MKIKTLILLSLIFVFGCKCNKTSTDMASKSVETVLIAKGNLYGSGAEGIEKQNLVITNEKDWNALINQMDTINKVSQSFTETKIDFSKYTVIAVFLNVKGSGGHSIDLDVSTTSEQKIVTVKHKGPKGNATSVMTQPYYIAKLVKSNLPIMFQ
ncbi:protease complex subunit PrcB family protein [Winogradskyella endarachnes]|uniref:PrcB C-terminal domain-containing protein n=1 Tax=Winogradskyella endarachnes TaxID=2681965 RepID=A0A6L6UBG5_9FLAO|nr:protease complex subunit PrcB family protein [Winogradskyella endarachnes]MUU79319.1 hypothetical protein [Winogradskyella endarachnes]